MQLRFYGRRFFPDHLNPVSYKGKHQLGLLFQCRNKLWRDIESDIKINRFGDYRFDTFASSLSSEKPHDSETENICIIKDYFNRECQVVDHTWLKNSFVNWPQNTLEEWVIDYNNDFFLRIDTVYDNEKMEAELSIRVYGESNLPWYEYADSYEQAQILYKLSNNL